MPHPPVNIGEPFITYSRVESTNDEARTAIQNGLATAGMAFFSSNQVAGRGQRGRKWWGEPGASLALSIVLQPDFLTVLQQFELSAALTLGVWDGIASMTGQDQLRIKWPNDLYWGNKKLGGILIESVISSSGHWSWAIAGIGLNINVQQFDPSIPNPISLQTITKKSREPMEVAKELIPFIRERIEQLQQGQVAVQYEAYQQLLYKRGERVQFKIRDRVSWAVVQGITPKGELRLEGEPKPHSTGSVEWIQ